MALYEREYYIRNWNFDPLKERVELNSEGTAYRYEKKYYLEKDKILFHTDVMLSARVDVIEEDVFTYIVWSLGKREVPVRCVHTAIFEGSMEEMDAIGVKRIQEQLPSKNPKLVKLVPEEHFVALKGFVKGIVKKGIRMHFYLLLKNGVNTYPLRRRLLKGLYDLSPAYFLRMLHDITENLSIDVRKLFEGL